MITDSTKIALFRGKKVRRTIFQNEWWFVVEDVVVVLTDSSNPKDYINKMRRRDNELSKGYGQIVHTPMKTLAVYRNSRAMQKRAVTSPEAQEDNWKNGWEGASFHRRIISRLCQEEKY